ncbi:S8 family serine peptidase, partial [Paenibacillus popilliae]
ESGGITLGSRYTGNFGGTSSATPLVAGVAALMLSANPDLRAAEVKTILQLTADKIQDTLPDHNGNNRGTYDQKGHSEWFGYGKVNAAKAVKEATKRSEGVRKP